MGEKKTIFPLIYIIFFSVKRFIFFFSFFAYFIYTAYTIYYGVLYGIIFDIQPEDWFIL